MREATTIFALDIGTRSVVGIILNKVDGQYHINDIVIKEHSERSMIDGQIHDVLAVSNVILAIKNDLETRHGHLTKVCVAAAGRALKTEKANLSIDISGKIFMQKQDILHLELSAVQQAQISLANKQNNENNHHYYCVGYSVIRYLLDQQDIGNLIDQQGDQASVEVIATFLPKVVVESLMSALTRAGLEMDALTLEPIAAINVLIPPTMRRLNVALVDIGAGTSDIAITDLGTIVSYGMVPVAGDEITEAISDQLLLDFPLAEKAKRELNDNESITVTDILGFETEIPKKEIIEQIGTTIDKLASSISNEILSLNGNRSPKAVMLVGGGSLTPELPKRLAHMLNLPDNRVAIRGIDAIQNVVMSDDITKGPELVTPIGIAIASEQSPVQYISVYVNKKPVRLFDMKQLTIGDCLLASGIKMNKLYGKPGMAMIVTVNGQNITIPGRHGNPPILLKNDEPCSLDDEIGNGDQITVERGTDGSQSHAKVKDLIDEIPLKRIVINGTSYVIKAAILQNSVVATEEHIVKDHDVLTYKYPETAEQAFTSLGLVNLLKTLSSFNVALNDAKVNIPEFTRKLFKNGRETTISASFSDGDSFTLGEVIHPTIEKLADIKDLKLFEKLPVFFNGEKIVLQKTVNEIYRNGQLLHEDDVLSTNDRLQIISKKIEPFIFQDLFRHVEITLPVTSKGRFILEKNNKEVSFHERLTAGDQLRIIWPADSF
ncbi:cell division protein FtsA [Cytobacillus sp. S13-E01]|uniref:cell division protein FtsA n=1 Tax=Cytobacillus sp. S13-E01 TaxID=3031326 RepID=UPI0023D7FA3E|nr:cell division protein FtsA [Cytobacillus sp. S13-E01]MDF0726453.1 cell division protein FtsA [Cytobacillus sp. S13-E01]